MSSKAEFVRTFFEAAWANPPASAVEASETYLSDDFQALDQDGNAQMDKAAYIGFGQLLFASFKDFKYVYSDIRGSGEDVLVNGHWEGTHTSDLDLSAMGMGVIPASGKKIVWPEESVEWKVEGDKIISIRPQGHTGELEEFLKPLGVEMLSE
jgi:hypothetical protein